MTGVGVEMDATHESMYQLNDISYDISNAIGRLANDFPQSLERDLAVNTLEMALIYIKQMPLS